MSQDSDDSQDFESVAALVSYQLKFPDAEAIFSWTPAKLDEVFDSALIVLDTNVLLAPYGVSTHGLKEIEKKLKMLVENKRLFVTAQTAREFAANRPVKYGELHQRLESQKTVDKTDDKYTKYPFFDEESAYRGLQSKFDEIKDLNIKLAVLRKDRDKSIEELKSIVENWSYNDPVSNAYRDMFANGVVIEEENFDLNEAVEEYKIRLRNKMPPGYKDSSKSENAIGDYLIWRTILYIARQERHLVFVTGELKPDWVVKSNNKMICARYELIDEYRRVSKGKTFYIIQFSELLSRLNVEKAVVEGVKEQEKPTFTGPYNFPLTDLEIAVANFFARGDREKIEIAPPDTRFSFMLFREPIFRSAVAIIRSHDKDAETLKNEVFDFSKYSRVSRDQPLLVVVVLNERSDVEKYQEIRTISWGGIYMIRIIFGTYINPFFNHVDTIPI